MKPVRVRLDDASFEVAHDESLLDACLRSAVVIPFSCRGGICQTCMLRCVEGRVPEEAQRGVPADLREKGYLLACQCRPESELHLARPRADDYRTGCVLHAVQRAGPYLHVQFESVRALPCKPGQQLKVLNAAGPSPLLQVTRSNTAEFLLEGLVQGGAESELPRWLEEGELGFEFEVAGPLDEPAGEGCAAELENPEPDPELWHELGDGQRVREVLEDFYVRVYGDERLAPFFQRVTLARSVDKQYSFLRQLMTGERVYFGDRPRNAHHWMVISEELFDYRQAVMEACLAAHGLTEAQVARWTRLELHFRSDIVKAAAFPRRVGGEDQPLEGYERLVLDCGTVCDHCGRAVEPGTEVTYHVRLGLVSCAACTGSRT